MTLRVQIAHAAPRIASAVAVNSRHDPGNGVIVVHPTPGHGSEGIARDVLQALGKRFRDRTPRDPRRLQALAGIWLRAELTRELVIGGADRRPATDWVVLGDLCSETLTRLTFVVERRPDRDQLATLWAADVRELTVPELVQELPSATPPDTWGIFDESGTPDERPGYPPVPDVDFLSFPSACTDLLPEHDAARVLRAFERARALTMLWFELRRGFEPRHGPGPRHAHALLDTLAAAGALASATRASAKQIAELTLGSVARTGATFASGHRINPPFQAPVAAQELARRAAGADTSDPLFLTPGQTRAATPRHIHNQLERIGRDTGLRFDTTTGRNRYTTRPWATFHQLAAGLITA